MAHSTTGGLPIPLTCAVRAWPGGLFLFSPFPPSPFFFSLLGEMGQVGGVQISRVLGRVFSKSFSTLLSHNRIERLIVFRRFLGLNPPPFSQKEETFAKEQN